MRPHNSNRLYVLTELGFAFFPLEKGDGKASFNEMDPFRKGLLPKKGDISGEGTFAVWFEGANVEGLNSDALAFNLKGDVADFSDLSAFSSIFVASEDLSGFSSVFVASTCFSSVFTGAGVAIFSSAFFS